MGWGVYGQTAILFDVEPTLKESWSQIITVEDYEGHMAEIGQAKANALIVQNFMLELEVKPKDRILFAGAGPGQMFDYIPQKTFGGGHIVFTDINERFLTRLEERAKQEGLTNFEVVLDDVEDPQVKGPFDLVVLVLVLEHVQWRKALAKLAQLPASAFLIVVQENPVGLASAVSPQRVLRPSLQEAMKGQHAELVDQSELITEMGTVGFTVLKTDRESVADGKTMCGFVFSRASR